MRDGEQPALVDQVQHDSGGSEGRPADVGDGRGDVPDGDRPGQRPGERQQQRRAGPGGGGGALGGAGGLLARGGRGVRARARAGRAGRAGRGGRGGPGARGGGAGAGGPPAGQPFPGRAFARGPAVVEVGDQAGDPHRAAVHVQHHLAGLLDPDHPAAPARYPVADPVRAAGGECLGHRGLDVREVLGMDHEVQGGRGGGAAALRRGPADQSQRLGVPEGLAGDQVAFEGPVPGGPDGQREHRVGRRGGRTVGAGAQAGAHPVRRTPVRAPLVSRTARGSVRSAECSGAGPGVLQQVPEPVPAGVREGLQHVQVAPGDGSPVREREREDAERPGVDDHRQGGDGDHPGAHSGVPVRIVGTGAFGAQQIGAAQPQGHRGGQVPGRIDHAVALVGPVGQSVGGREPEHPGGVQQVEGRALAGDPAGPLGEDGAEQVGGAGAAQQ